MPSLAACFASSCRAGVPAADEAALRAYVAAARASWPGSAIDDETLVKHAAERADERGLPEHGGDLLLALGCLRGLPEALAAFELRYADVIERVLQKRRADALADDVAQIVRERLLLGREGAAPQIAGYRGTGPLRSWVAIATSTQLAMARRSEGRRREQPEQDLIAGDPELRYLQQRYKSEVEQAVVHGLRTLGDRERVILRLQLGERLTLEQLAAMYTVDRATIARWLAKARQNLMQAIRLELRARTGAAEGTCEDLLKLVQSQLDVSVLRHLS
ncbi:MAG TPA: sigma-70 family RNA polymerase sigma factor [Polyangiales bacterium]|nr:sigma-70 family RNA polymerase sigma factor [Polyangiales bacterium]